MQKNATVSKGYLIRAQKIQELAYQYYEPENHSKCFKMVWKKYIHPMFGINYRTFLNYMKVDLQEEEQV